MAESYSAVVSLSAVDKGLISTLKAASGAVDGLGNKLKSGIGFGFLTGIGQKAFSVISSGVSGLVGEINSSNAAWKTFTANMEMLGKSGSEIDGVKKELQEFAEQTVYSSSDMATTFAQLEAVGVKNTASLVKGFGGLAAAAENPQQAMKTLSTQATQMAAKPSVAWQDFKLMLEQTPAGIAAVAKEMGMTTSELVSNVQDGKVSTDEFFKAIETAGTSDAFTKLATQPKTVSQALDGLTEAVGNKLIPAFDVLSNVGIKAVDSLAGALEGIDGQAIADTVSSAVETVGEFLDIMKTSFSGVGESVGSAFSAVKEALSGVSGEFSKTSAMERFKSICDTVAGAIQKVAGFIEDHADTIAKVLPYVGKLAGAFVALKVVNSIAPGLTSFAGSLLKMAGKGIAGLAAKLIGIAGGQKAVGAASASSGPSILQCAVATLALGAAVLLAAVGLALIVQSAIALASAGWPAAAAMLALVGVIALLAIGAAALGPALTAGAVGFIAFGAAIALIGAGAALAGLGLSLIANVLPLIVMYGAMGAVAMIQLGAGLALFAVGAALAGAAVIVLGTGLLLVASALLIAGAAMLLFGVGALLAATSLLILSTCMPVLAQYGLQASVAILALGAALLVFGAGALVAGAGALVLGAGLMVVATAVAIVAAAFLVLSVGALLTAASLAILAAVLPLIAAYGTQGAMAIALLGASMLVFAVGAGIAGAAAVLLSAGLIAASVGFTLAAVTLGILAASMTLLAVSTLLAAAGFGVIAAAIVTILAGGMAAALVLTQMNMPLLKFVPAATVAGAAALVLASGFAALAIATAALAIAMLGLGTGLITVGVGAMLAAAGLALLSVALPLITANATQNAMALAILSAGLSIFAIGAGIAGAAALVAAMAVLSLLAATTVTGVGLMLFGTFAMIASVGLLLMATALKAVQKSMSSIAKNATKAKKALDSMQDSVSIVEAGLKGLGSLAESAMDGVAKAFKGAASDAKTAGQEVAQGFTNGMQIVVVSAPAMAMMAVAATNAALKSGQSGAYQSGQFISIGFANGMLSMLGTVRSAANKIVKEANRAIEAKAKIGSPSKITTQYGEWYGEGYGNGISNMERYVWKAAENLVSLPNVATPDLAMAYGGELSSEYAYYRNADYRIEVPLSVDGKEFARATAHYNEAELNRRNQRDSRKHGIV